MDAKVDPRKTFYCLRRWPSECSCRRTMSAMCKSVLGSKCWDNHELYEVFAGIAYVVSQEKTVGKHEYNQIIADAKR